MRENKYFAPLKELLSLEFNCSPEDFDRAENVLAISAPKEGGRVYGGGFFCMATFGGNAVITANELLHPFLREYIKDKRGFWLFEQPNVIPIETELNKHGYTLTHSHHLFLPEYDVTPKGDFEVKWFEGYEQLAPYYGVFHNALCESYDPSRPDIVAVCAYDTRDNDKIMGMAGCSADTADWYQIGIDVLPEYRGQGVGTYLTALLKNEILSRGKIPFYGTGIANFHSMNIALNCGFRPAWVEMGSEKIK